MPTPPALVGQPNPRTGSPYGPEIRESLGRVRHLPEARRRRDLRLGEVRAEEQRLTGTSGGSLGEALTLAAELRKVEHDDDREAFEGALIDRAEALDKKVGER